MSELTKLRKALRAAILLEDKVWQQIETLRQLQLSLAWRIVFAERGPKVSLDDMARGIGVALRAAGLNTKRACSAPQRYVVEDEKLQPREESVES